LRQPCYIACMRRVCGCIALVLCFTASPAGRSGQLAAISRPHSEGLADDPNLPDHWSQTENVVWKTEIPGRGWSSPIVWGDRIFVTTVVSAQPKEKAKKGLYFAASAAHQPTKHRWMLYCLDYQSGKILWEREVHKGVPSGSRHLKNSYASETPTTDGELVYALFRQCRHLCLRHERQAGFGRGASNPTRPSTAGARRLRPSFIRAACT